MSEEKAYWTHEISDMLGVSDSTLRKWCLALEKQGYKFTKGENNSRAFLVRDRNILIELKYLVRTTGMSLEKASYQVLSDLNLTNDNGVNDPRSSAPEVVRESFEEGLKKINDRLDRQEEFNQKILDRIDQRDQNLMAVLRELQETKKEIAMTTAKKKKWWQFWKE